MQAKFIKMCEREGLFVAESFDPRDASMDYSEKIIRLSFAIRANHGSPTCLGAAPPSLGVMFPPVAELFTY